MSRDLSAAQLREVVATERVLLSPLCSEPREDGWPAAAVKAVMRLLDASQGSLFQVAPSDLVPPLSWEYSTLDATMLRSYQTDYWQHDFLTRRILASGLDVMDLWCVTRPAEYRRSMFVQEYMRPNGVPDGIVLKTVLGGWTLLMLMNSDRMLDETKLRSWSALLELVRPAFAAGVAARQLLGHHREQLGQVFDDLAVPVLLGDASARVLHRNVALCALLAQDPGADNLLGGAHRLLAQLRAFLVYSSTQHERRESERVALEIQTPIARYRLQGSIAWHDPFSREPTLLIVFERLQARMPAHETLQTRFALTPREAQVAFLLAERRRNREIAEILGISTHTAERHTENVLMKLGVHSRDAVGERIARDDVRERIALGPATDAEDARADAR